MTKRLLGLTAMLLAAYFLVSQVGAATSHGVEPMGEACVLLPDAQEMPDCSRLLAQGSCSSTCISSHVGKSAILDLPILSSSLFPWDHSSHSGRVLSGSDPFPPKYSAIS